MLAYPPIMTALSFSCIIGMYSQLVKAAHNVTIENDDPSLHYEGDWTVLSSIGLGHNRTIHVANAMNCTMTFNYTGND